MLKFPSKGSIRVLPLVPSKDDSVAAADGIMVHARMLSRREVLEFFQRARLIDLRSKAGEATEVDSLALAEDIIAAILVKLPGVWVGDRDLGDGGDPRSLAEALSDVHLAEHVAAVCLRAQTPTMEEVAFLAP